MDIKERVSQELETLTEDELQQVAEYLAFLRFRARRNLSSSLDLDQIAALYAEFGEEDRQLAEEGMEDYAEGLRAEDER
jgi:hypothetical protein